MGNFYRCDLVAREPGRSLASHIHTAQGIATTGVSRMLLVGLLGFTSRFPSQVFTYTLGLLVVFSLGVPNSIQQGTAQAGNYSPGAKLGDDEFDRLDGKGESGKRVDVIEWAGNLEIHVYPSKSLAGLALKLDKKNKNRPVMVIAYRFDSNPEKQLIRRAILGISLFEPLTVYRDTSVDEYDKILITNHKLTAKNLVSLRLDPEPKHSYPEGHPGRAIANEKPTSQKVVPKKIEEVGDEGTIRPFTW